MSAVSPPAPAAVAPGTRGKGGARRRRLALHGWLVIDKPAGMTSTQVVGRVRRLTGAAKAGHAGTLDPLATGVLPLALGEATKTVSYVMDGVKRYRFTVRWGEARDTDDADGEVVAVSDVRPDRAGIEAALAGFIGEIKQVPPAFSALKVNGQRAYDLARNKQPVALEARPIQVYDLIVEAVPDRDHAVLVATCGKGSYVRALARDLARALGTVGHVAALCRTQVGPFALADAISLAELETLSDVTALRTRLLPIGAGLAQVPEMTVTADQAGRLKHGQVVPLVRRPRDQDGDAIAAPATVVAMFAERPVALVRFEKGDIRPLRVFNL